MGVMRTLPGMPLSWAVAPVMAHVILGFRGNLGSEGIGGEGVGGVAFSDLMVG